MVLTLKILLAFVAIGLLLLLICLAAPLTYEFSLNGAQGKIRFRMDCRNLFWKISTRRGENHTDTEQRIFNRTLSKPTKIESSASARPASDTKAHPKPTAPLLPKAMGDSALLKRSLKFILEIWQKVKPRHLTVNACIGCSEPHQTGWMMAMAAMLQADNDCYIINIAGNWLEPCLDGEICIAGKFIPAVILWQVVKLLACSEVRPYYRIYLNRIILALAQTVL